MTTIPNHPDPEVLNPRYEGATPEMVARALLRAKSKGEAQDQGGRPST